MILNLPQLTGRSSCHFSDFYASLEDQEEDKALPWDDPWMLFLPYPPYLPA